MDVTCEVCGHSAVLSDPEPIQTPSGPQAPEIRWQCDCKVDPASHPGVECDCEAINYIAGSSGEPGEGALNPEATALTDEQLRAAAESRGIIHHVEVGGNISAEGSQQ